MIHCSNCNNLVTDNFCGKCGQPVQVKRVDGRFILHEIQHVLHLEKGIIYTITELLIRPGQTVRTFIAKDRSRLVKPVIFIVVTSLVFTIINALFHLEKDYSHVNGLKNSSLTVILPWILHHFGYANILIGMSIAFWLKLFYKAQGYNFFEVVILLCFVMGIGMLLYAVFALIEGLTNLNLTAVSTIIVMGYSIWAIVQFFSNRNAMSYFKATVSYITGVLTFYISVIFLIVLIDLLV